ncbi:hypothetical protein HII31_01306 [Pseudocercospora fuligena]|uniref:NB-ARC domain-containing protein n=1 Tax=Pseudocercospora fuligena TaxID=685502 RepID=A0A8H6RWI0_9PEZI|nr:hypothetical protein HII31_01306 [Pseudocercospora fuligena]
MSFGNSYKNGVGLVPISKAEQSSNNPVEGIALGDVNIYAFEPWSSIDDSFTWAEYFNHGNTLVKILATRLPDPGGTLKPVVLMAHSLAGFILKQTLIVVHSQLEKYATLRDAIKGAVYLGCPHSSTLGSRDVLYDRSLAILQLQSELSSRTSKRLKAGSELTDLCKAYDDMGGNVPVLTVYEQKPTKQGSRGFLFKHNNHDIVDKQLAKIGYKFEDVEGISTDHCELPSLRDDHSKGGIDDDVVRWIQNVIKHASGPSRSQPTARSEYSLRLRDSSPPLNARSGREHIASEPLALDPLIQAFATEKPVPKNIPCFSVDIARQRNRKFFGRTDVLSNLESLLVESQQVAVLYGMGGVGKSEVALQFVHKHKASFDAVLWIQSDDLFKVRQVFGGFAAELGLEDGQTDPFTSRELVKTWLMNPIKSQGQSKDTAKAKWLIVFDGADQPGVLAEFECLRGKGSMLVTSRNPATRAVLYFTDTKAGGISSSGVTEINLRPFSHEEGAKVLKQLANVDDEDEKAMELAKRLDGWPLAIVRMAGIVRKLDLTLDEFCEKYNDDSNHGNFHAQGDSGADTMASSIRMALLSAPATALLRICSLLDPDGIQETLFSLASETTLPIDDFPTTADAFVIARAELISASLLQRNKAKQELWMHRVVQETVRGQCSQGTLDRAFVTACRLVNKAWHPPPESVRDNLKIWQPCAAFLKHVVYLQQVYKDSMEPCYEFASLINEASCLQRNLGHTSGLRRALDLALSVCYKLPKMSRFELMSEIYHSLGAWANETNHPDECMQYNTRYLQMREDAVKAGQKADERTAAAYNQYGTALMMVRDNTKAMENFQRSIDLYKELASDIALPCPDSLAVVNLAVAKTLAGDYDRALKLLEDGLLAREEAFGYMDTDSFRTGRFYHALGNVCWEQQRHRTSEIWHTRALKQYTKSLGPRHHRTADVRHRVAMHCLRKEDHIEAGALIDQALESWGMDPESFGPEIARTTWLKAKQQIQAGNSIASAELSEQAVGMRRRLGPRDLRAASELKDEDFDDLVAFWSR